MRYLTLILVLAFATTLSARICRQLDDPFPGTTTGQCARQFIATLNNPTPDSVRDFETRWASKARLEKSPIDHRIDSLAKLHQDYGDLKVIKVTAATPLTAFTTCAHAEEMALQFLMSSTEGDKLDSVQIMPASEVSTAAPLTPELRNSTVDGVARALRDGYVFPPIGARMADSIQAKLKAGEYDSITDERGLALRLTDDCRAISKDKHLGVRPVSKSSASQAPAREDPRRDNFGFRRVELLPGNIGYLRFDMFFEGTEAYTVASNAMNFLAGADAIIFDMRHNGGGSPEMIRYITSYLFDTRTHLNDMVDRDGKTVEEYWTLESVPGRRPRTGIPLYVLTSARTFSGAEEFSYNLQNLERATIIGETTGGGAHPVQGSRVNDRFMVRVPFMRAQNPITHTNWEGKGVEPDIKTSAEAALDKALELARAAIKK